MKRYLALGCFGVGLMVSPVLAGVGHAAVPANPRIGIIDMQDTLATTPAGKRAQAAFDNLRKAKQAQLEKQQTDLQKEAAELDKQRSGLSPAVAEQRTQALQRKLADLQALYVRLEREVAQDRTKMIQDLLKQAEPKIAAIAKAEGVTVIMDKATTVWSEPTTDLTAKLNAEMK